MSPWIIWLIAAALLLVAEVLTQAVWAFCFAIGCLAAMVLSYFTPSPGLQALVVALGAIASWILLAPVVRRWEKKRRHVSPTGMEALIGRSAFVTEEILPGQRGRARIDGDVWLVEAPDTPQPILPGQEVSVIGYNSIVLTVKPKN